MYDGATYDPQTHLLEFADVGLMSLYVADCDALAKIADALGKRPRPRNCASGGALPAKLATLWDEQAGIFLNRDLHTGQAEHAAFAHQLLSDAGARGHAGTGKQ